MPHAVSWLYAKRNTCTCVVPQSRPFCLTDESSLSCSEEASGWKHNLTRRAATSFEISVNFYKTTWCHTLQAMPTGEVGGGGNLYKLAGNGCLEWDPGPEWVACVFIFNRSRPSWGVQNCIHQHPYPLPAALPTSHNLFRELLFAWHLREV
jgi:hypothetical protein